VIFEENVSAAQQKRFRKAINSEQLTYRKIFYANTFLYCIVLISLDT